MLKGFSSASLLITWSVDDLPPAELGVKLTLTVVLAPGASVVALSAVTEKFDALPPVTSTFKPVRLAVPVLLMVIDSLGLVEPRVMVPKPMVDEPFERFDPLERLIAISGFCGGGV